jgi:hypothetical protein
MSNCGNGTRRQFLQEATAAIALFVCPAPLVLGTAAAKPGEPAVSYPLVPFSTIVDVWDHHWFLWLPHHPVYEAVEVASREPDRDGRVAVWTWFTERTGSKRQIHYRNDARLATLVGGNYRPIDYQISGNDGRPRGVQVRFNDIENMPVEIDVAFDPDQVLTRQGAGLTDQSGHLSDRAFLVFYRDNNALAREGRASIETRNYAFGHEEAQGAFPFRWAYSHGIFIGLILYNSFKATFGADGYAPSPQKAGVYVLNRAWGGSVSLRCDQTGRLNEYLDRGANSEFLQVVFDPPLPSWGSDHERRSSSFSISIAAAADVVKGRVENSRTDRGQSLEWIPSEPLWTSKQGFRSEIAAADDHSLLVSVTPAR